MSEHAVGGFQSDSGLNYLSFTLKENGGVVGMVAQDESGVHAQNFGTRQASSTVLYTALDGVGWGAGAEHNLSARDRSFFGAWRDVKTDNQGVASVSVACSQRPAMARLIEATNIAWISSQTDGTGYSMRGAFGLGPQTSVSTGMQYEASLDSGLVIMALASMPSRPGGEQTGSIEWTGPGLSEVVDFPRGTEPFFMLRTSNATGDYRLQIERQAEGFGELYGILAIFENSAPNRFGAR